MKKFALAATAAVVSLGLATPAMAQSNSNGQTNTPTRNSGSLFTPNPSLQVRVPPAPNAFSGERGRVQNRYLEIAWLSTRFNGEEYRTSAQLYRQAINVADCVAASKGAGMMEYVLIGDTGDYEKMVREIRKNHGICVDTMAYSVPADFLHAAMAHKAVRLERRTAMVDPDLARDYVAGDEEEASIEMVSRCLVANNARAVRTYLDSDLAESNEEEAARLDALYASMPQCGLSESPDASTLYQRIALSHSLSQWVRLT